jgi:hypothetical protein
MCFRPRRIYLISPVTSGFVRVIRRYRFWMKPQRVGGWVWWLSMLWAGIGACVSGLFFLSSTQPVTVSGDGIPAWLGGPGVATVISYSGAVAIVVWLVLTIPVLVAGRARLRGWRQGRWLWAGAWVVGLVLMPYIRVCADTLPSITKCSNDDGCSSVLYYGPALVNWRELAICVAFVAIAAVLTTLLARPEAIVRLWRKRGDLIQACEPWTAPGQTQ